MSIQFQKSRVNISVLRSKLLVKIDPHPTPVDERVKKIEQIGETKQSYTIYPNLSSTLKLQSSRIKRVCQYPQIEKLEKFVHIGEQN